MTGEKNEKEGGNESAPDTNSPLYVHPSDSTKQLHVHDLLTDSNYGDWSREMMNFLFVKNKVGFIDGTIKKPDKTSPNHMPWMRCDAMVKGWLTTAMEKDIRNSVKYADTASEIWSDLLERFGKESAPRAYELKQQIAATRQNGASISAYYTKLRSLWDEAQSVVSWPHCSCTGCTCGVGKKLVAHHEKERLYEFLMGLDVEFDVIKTQILSMKPTPTLGAAYHMAAEDEQQRSISANKKSSIETAAFKVSMRHEGGNNHPRDRNIQRNGKQIEDVEQCNFCGRKGHNRDGCFKRIGYPDWWPGKTKGDRGKPKAACIETGPSPIPGLTNDQYQTFLRHFAEPGDTSKEETQPTANMAGVAFEGLDWCG